VARATPATRHQELQRVGEVVAAARGDLLGASAVGYPAQRLLTSGPGAQATKDALGQDRVALQAAAKLLAKARSDIAKALRSSFTSGLVTSIGELKAALTALEAGAYSSAVADMTSSATAAATVLAGWRNLLANGDATLGLG
jgi:hypothetical protein